jgi:DnaK suppressor protein
MDAEKREEYRQLLMDEMKSLLSEADKTVHEMADDASHFPDPTDRATQESDRTFELRIRDRERKLLNKIKEALDRLETDEYGICEECGDLISDARLKARPVTTLCIDCKMEAEVKEKRL